MQLREVGLLDEWATRSRPDPRQCLFQKTKHTAKSLTLKGLSGGFVVLAFGIVASVLVFVLEHIIFRQFSPRGCLTKKKVVK